MNVEIARHVHRIGEGNRADRADRRGIGEAAAEGEGAGTECIVVTNLDHAGNLVDGDRAGGGGAEDAEDGPAIDGGGSGEVIRLGKDHRAGTIDGECIRACDGVRGGNGEGAATAAEAVGGSLRGEGAGVADVSNRAERSSGKAGGVEVKVRGGVVVCSNGAGGGGGHPVEQGSGDVGRAECGTEHGSAVGVDSEVPGSARDGGWGIKACHTVVE